MSRWPARRQARNRARAVPHAVGQSLVRSTPDLDAFLKAVSGRPDRSSLRLKTLNWNDAAEVITLKLDKHYFPAYEVRRTAAGWERRLLE